MSEKRKAIVFAGLAIFVLLGGCLVALFLPRFQVAIVVASFIGYVACTRRALVLCRADELVFEPRNSGAREQAARAALRARTLNATPPVASSGSARRAQPAYPRPVEGTR